MENEEIKRVLVTGASGGIGRAIAVEAAKAGYYVICHYNGSEAKAQETLAQVKACGSDGEIIQFNVADRDDCKAKLSEIVAKYGALWGIVNNAGVTRDNTFVALSGEDWDKVIHTNLDSFYNVLNPLLMPMVSRKNKRGGRIITVSSVSGVDGNRGQTNYSASKAGIIGATKALAVELAGRGITCNVIAPGVIETDMTKAIRPDVYEIIMQSIPMGRAGKPEEIGALAAFLLSDGAAYITRQCIECDGGM
ncbi:MAG: 3-oxoacyl-ACP reductase FabG [Treponema sp.]|nr:3-oxoacyl-ACP reductase FabG [Treponema sp.]